MYVASPGLVLGFHGCDAKTVSDVVNKRTDFRKSTNSYDWLGHGMYFWEGNYDRALSFAEEQKANPRQGGQVIRNPAVLGAVIDLKNCLNLCDEAHLKLVQTTYEFFELSFSDKSKLPKNKTGGSTNDMLIRELDCAVIEHVHELNPGRPFDSVKSPFFEGGALYESAGFGAKNHIQICIRNPDCILGFFIPRMPLGEWDGY